MNTTMKKLAIALVVVFTVSMAMLGLGTPVATGRPAAQGGDLFKAKCAPCHGADASGNTVMGKKLNIRDLRSAEVQGQSDAQLAATISKGKGKMPAYGQSLSQEQIKQLVAFIRTLKQG
jgi:mono/diheme cytochrome c family protein